MLRREFLRSSAVIAAAAALPRNGFAEIAFSPKPDTWRRFEITTRVELANSSGRAQA